jgi:hypothetical protein
MNFESGPAAHFNTLFSHADTFNLTRIDYYLNILFATPQS